MVNSIMSSGNSGVAGCFNVSLLEPEIRDCMGLEQEIRDSFRVEQEIRDALGLEQEVRDSRGLHYRH